MTGAMQWLFGGHRSAPTMEQAIALWRDWLLAAGRSKQTVKSYVWDAQHLAQWRPELAPDQFKAADLVRYQAERRAAEVGDESRRRSVSALRSFFAFTVGEAKSPARTLPRPSAKKRVQRTLSDKEALCVLASCDTSKAVGARDLAVLAVMLDAGLRASEVCRLQLADCDLERGLVLVVVKGGQQRFGALSAHTRAIVAQWIGHRERLALEGEGALFVALRSSGRGRALTREGLGCLCRRLAGRAGVPHFSPHALRRTFATLAIANGASTRVVQMAGGWSNIGQVERYSRALDPAVFAPFAPVARLIDGI